MHVLTFANQKGGCGKTTSAVNLAGALAARGSRTLLVDLDPQAHATMALSCAGEQGTSLVDVLMSGTAIELAIRSAPGGIDLIPSTEALAEFEEVSARRMNSDSVLAAALARIEKAYDFVILDCPPRVEGILCANALVACDTVILVVESGAFALQGALKARRLIEDRGIDRESPFDIRVLATMFDRRLRIAQDLLIGTQARFAEQMFDSVIHTSVRLREAAAYGIPVQVLDPKCRAVRDFETLAEEIIEHSEKLRASTPAPISTTTL
ncbi:MAG: chromosome partitioning protein [Planctomycetota bacterium]|jgi:chromosome partitioning protein